MLIFVHP